MCISVCALQLQCFGCVRVRGAGLSVCVSGTVEQEGRTQMQKLKFKRFIPKNLNYSNAGEKRTKRKLNSTKKLGRKLGKQRENNNKEYTARMTVRLTVSIMVRI